MAWKKRIPIVSESGKNDRLRRARISAAIAVGSIVVGWGVAQYPWILVDEMRIDEMVTDSTTLWGLVIAFGLAALLVAPPLVFLYVLADRNEVGVE